MPQMPKQPGSKHGKRKLGGRANRHKGSDKAVRRLAAINKDKRRRACRLSTIH